MSDAMYTMESELSGERTAADLQNTINQETFELLKMLSAKIEYLEKLVRGEKE